MNAKHLITIASLALAMPMMADDYEMTAPDLFPWPNQTVEEPVSLINDNPVLGFQCTIVPSPQLTMEADGITATERTAGHSVKATKQPDGSIIVTAVNLDSQPISGTSGPVLDITLTAPKIEKATFSIKLEHIVLSVQGVGKVKLPDVTIPVVLDAPTGVEDIDADSSPAIYYDLQGRRADHPTKGQIYIRLKGGQPAKVRLQ